MPKFSFVATKDGGMDFGTHREKLKRDLKSNPGAKYVVERETPESSRQRRFYHGAVIPLWAYLDGNDYTDSAVLEKYHQYAKEEFNGEVIVMDGKTQRIGKSTRGSLNSGFLERLIRHLEEQYQVDRTQCLNHKDYKYYRDVLLMDSEYPTYIDYLVALRKVPIV